MSTVLNLERQVQQVQNGWRRQARWVQWTIIGLAVLLAGLRMSLPFALTRYANERLNRIPEYSGSIGKVKVHLWRGAYELRDIVVSKSTGKVPVPLFSAPGVELSIQWAELFHGAVVGEVLVRQPELNFVAGPTPEQTQTDINKPWGKTLASFFPFRINKFEIRNGQVRFRNFHAAYPVNIYITNLCCVATNLTNTRSVQQALPAGLQASGQALGTGHFAVDLKMDPLQTAPTFELSASLTNVNLVELNDFLRSYAKLDVAKGEFSMFTSVASMQGTYQGYVKVLFEKLEVFKWEKERKKNILGVFWEAIVGVLSEVFQKSSA